MKKTMTVKKVQFESMDEVNRFLDVTEHFPFAVDLKHLNIQRRSTMFMVWSTALRDF